MPFLIEPAESDGQQALYAEDLAEDGFVWDVTRQWAHQPALHEQFMALIRAAAAAAGLSDREKAMLVLGTASTLGDAYCSVAWGRFLTEWADADTAAAVLSGADTSLSEREQALAQWARKIARDPNATVPDDIESLRAAGFGDPQILALTLYGALRLALSTTNDALGSAPDAALADMLDPEVRKTITWGRRSA